MVASKTIPGQFSLRVIKEGKQVPLQLNLKDAGFVPGDILHIGLLDDFENLEHEANDREDQDDLKHEIDDLEYRISRAISALEGF